MRGLALSVSAAVRSNGELVIDPTGDEERVRPLVLSQVVWFDATPKSFHRGSGPR